MLAHCDPVRRIPSPRRSLRGQPVLKTLRVLQIKRDLPVIGHRRWVFVGKLFARFNQLCSFTNIRATKECSGHVQQAELLDLNRRMNVRLFAEQNKCSLGHRERTHFWERQKLVTAQDAQMLVCIKAISNPVVQTGEPSSGLVIRWRLRNKLFQNLNRFVPCHFTCIDPSEQQHCLRILGIADHQRFEHFLCGNHLLLVEQTHDTGNGR